MKTILASTYAVNPYKGSEDGMGWNFVLQIARYNTVIAITRENNRKAIEKYMEENPNELYERIGFLYYDLPYWMRFWKKGSRGAMLYYLMWQYGIVSFIKKQKIQFDIVHNVNFHNDWTPSFLWKLGKPFVWGPVGHHPLIPSQFLAPYSLVYWIKDRLTWLLKKCFWHFSHNLNQCKKEAAHIWCMNSAVPKTLKINRNYSIYPSVATQDFGWIEHKSNEHFRVISAGRFVPLKGFDLSILAFAKMVNALPEKEKVRCELILVGSGPEEAFLKTLCKKHNIEAHVKFIAWIQRNDLMSLFKTSSVFLFPSHEGAGMVVPEALSFGLPVVCLNNEGPGEFIDNSCGFVVPSVAYNHTVNGLSYALKELFFNTSMRNQMSQNARQKFIDVFHWDKRGDHLKKIYEKI